MKSFRFWSLVGITLLVAGCEQGASEKQASVVSKRASQVKAFEKRLGAMLRSIPREPSDCPDGALRSAIARTQNRRVLFADATALKAAAQGKAMKGVSPLAFLMSPALGKRTPSSEMIDEKTATDGAFAIVSLEKNYDFLAVLEASFKAPEADDKGFHAGELRGRLALFDLAKAKPLCSSPVNADSSLEAVKKPGQSRQEAADKDFEMQIRRALEQTFSRMTNEVVLELG